MQLSDDERRALGIIAALLILAASGRWLERPRPLLDDTTALDVAALEQASIAARDSTAARASAPRSRSAASGSAAEARSATSAGNGAAPTSQDPVDLSRAAAAELERIPGVGPVLASRITARRDSLGGFDSWEEVDAVVGIGPAMLARLKELAVVRR